MNSRLQISIVIYLILTIIILQLNPKWTHNNGNLKQFGTGNNENKTVFPLWIILFVLATFSYYLSQIIIFVNNK